MTGIHDAGIYCTGEERKKQTLHSLKPYDIQHTGL